MFFASPQGAPTSRRATDALVLVAGLVGLIVLVIAYPPGSFERALSSFLGSFPGWLDALWVVAYDLLALWALVLFGVTLVSRRWALAVHAVAAFCLSVALAFAVSRVALGVWPDFARTIGGGSGSPSFPLVRVAEAGAVVLTISAHLTIGLQRLGRWILIGGLVAGLVLRPDIPSGSLAAILAAIVAAASVRLAFRTSLGRPGLGGVVAALSELGVDATGLRERPDHHAGVFELDARAEDGVPLLIKVYGRNAHDSHLLASVWRTLWYQDAGPPPGFSRVQAVEHEALVGLVAERAGVRTHAVVVAGATVARDALLVLRGEARPVHEFELDDGSLARCWAALAQLRAARIAHRALDPSTIAFFGPDVGFVDFAQATLTPTPDQLRTDRAQLLASTAAVAGVDRAIAAAVAAIGNEGVGELLPYLQPVALGPSLRRELKARAIDVDDLRKATARAVDATEPELFRFRRVTWETAIQLGLLVLAVIALMKLAGNVDFDDLREDLADASWGWIALGFVVCQLPRLTQSVASLGAIAARVRFGPLYVLQLATSYLNLALPSSIARMAVFVRFFQRQGHPGAAAVTAGAIDSFAANVIQALLVLCLVLFAAADVPLDLSAPSSGALRLLWILVAALVATVIVAVAVGRVRRAIVERVREWWPQVRVALAALRSSNKLILLVAGNLATEILFATGLGLMARGFGYDIPLIELIVINSGTSLLATFVPVPGGIGVTEFALEVGLTSAGMTASSAAGAILLYRMSTFYLPPIWGFFAFRWLQRNRYL